MITILTLKVRVLQKHLDEKEYDKSVKGVLYLLPIITVDRRKIGYE